MTSTMRYHTSYFGAIIGRKLDKLPTVASTSSFSAWEANFPPTSLPLLAQKLSGIRKERWKDEDAKMSRRSREEVASFHRHPRTTWGLLLLLRERRKLLPPPTTPPLTQMRRREQQGAEIGFLSFRMIRLENSWCEAYEEEEEEATPTFGLSLRLMFQFPEYLWAFTKEIGLRTNVFSLLLPRPLFSVGGYDEDVLMCGARIQAHDFELRTGSLNGTNIREFCFLNLLLAFWSFYGCESNFLLVLRCIFVQNRA